MKIKTWRDPYDAGFTPTRPKEIELHPGLTVLVGCNGAGKSTLLMNIKEVCRDNKIPCHLYDNITHGGSNTVFGDIMSGLSKDFECDSLGLATSMLWSSEGETIKAHIGRQSTKYKEFIQTGYFKNRDNKFISIFEKDLPDVVDDNRRLLLFDATDSGVSIDAICEIKAFFETVLEDASKQGKEMYIIIAANEYELARETDCFDVNEGKYIRFSDYEDYRKFIIKSRNKKENRIKNQIKWEEKQAEKEIEQYRKERIKAVCKMEKLKERESKGEHVNKYEKERIIDNLQRFKRNETRFAPIDQLDAIDEDINIDM